MKVHVYVIRRGLSKCRLSSYMLAIEKGHHQTPKIPEENKLCENCTNVKLKNKVHINRLIDLVSTILIKYTDMFSSKSDSIEAFVHIMSCEDETVFSFSKMYTKMF